MHRLSQDIDLTTAADSGDLDQLVAAVATQLSDRLEDTVTVEPPPIPLSAPDLQRVELAWAGRHRLQIDFSLKN